MKNIAIFCDGTWNAEDSTFRTNVALLSGSLTRDGTVPQVPIYLPGVGTGKGATFIDRMVDKAGGGAFGWGLNGKIEQAYRALADRYEAGDRIFVFGFSRGAYTARSLVGLIRNCGLPDATTKDRIPEAMRLYRDRTPGSHPDAPESLRFRAGFSPRYATSKVDAMSRRGPAVEVLAVDYLGVWDTVGALGVPDQFAGLAGLFNGKYKFHDLRLSSMVRQARHAVAIDERRKTFLPTVWENLTELNTGRGAVAPYQQEWFPGTHGGVGGGGAIVGLSHAALLWMMEGAEAAGLEIAASFKAEVAGKVDIAAPLDNHPGEKGFFTKLLERNAIDRPPPPGVAAVSDPAHRRWRDHGYRPVPLRPFGPLMKPPVMPDEWG